MLSGNVYEAVSYRDQRLQAYLLCVGYQEGGALNNGGCFNLIEITANSTVCMMIQLILLLETAMIIVLFCRVQRGKMRCK